MGAAAAPADAAQLGRLRWRCRRGMQELDVLLGGWLDAHWRSASAAQRAAFAELLEQQDPDLWAWCTGRSTAPRSDWQALIDDFRARAAH
jgi:antitoxin CptB